MISEYNENGNLVYCKREDDREEWHSYDENGNCIYTKRSDGFEYWARYNNNTLIWFKNSIGDEHWFKIN